MYMICQGLRCIENPVKHLKWSKKELLAKIVAWNYFQRHSNMSDRDLNPAKFLNVSRVLNMPGIEKVLNMCEHALE